MTLKDPINRSGRGTNLASKGKSGKSKEVCWCFNKSRCTYDPCKFKHNFVAKWVMVVTTVGRGKKKESKDASASK